MVCSLRARGEWVVSWVRFCVLLCCVLVSNGLCLGFGSACCCVTCQCWSGARILGCSLAVGVLTFQRWWNSAYFATLAVRLRRQLRRV